MNPCPWCGKPTEKVYLRLKDYFLSQEEFEIDECDGCGLLFTVPRPSPETIGKYYQSDEYYSHQENKKGLVPKLYENVKSLNLRNKVKMATLGLKTGRLLDIGCGVGDFLCHAQRQGWEVLGIEPSDQARTIAEARLGFRPLDPADSVTLSDGSFDLITMWHVLEHVDDLKFQTSELHRLLKPGGRLVIALPNFQSFDCQHFKEYWAAWDVPRHLNHFSSKTLCQMLAETGFTHLRDEKLVWDAFYISYLSEKYQGGSLPLLRGAFRGLQSNLRAQKSGQWSSMVYVFEKPLNDAER